MRPLAVLSMVLLAGLLTACLPGAPAPVSTARPATQPPVTVPRQTPATSVLDQSPLTPSASGSAGWMEYRDLPYGYGIALPCYWVVNPTPGQGIYATMTARSYTDQFLAQHSQRGEWPNGVWPAGAYKMDVVMVSGMDPALSVEDAIRSMYTTASEQQLDSLEQRTFGRRQGYLATVTGGLQGGETVRLVYFPLGPGALAIFNFLPSTAIDSPDAQAILSSFAPTVGEPVAFPSQAPSGPPDGSPIVCQ